jgi:hypothetical protein
LGNALGGQQLLMTPVEQQTLEAEAILGGSGDTGRKSSPDVVSTVRATFDLGSMLGDF